MKKIKRKYIQLIYVTSVFLKLYHFSKRQSTTGVATNSNISETYSFVPHTEDNCLICISLKGGRPLLKRSLSAAASQKHIKDIASQYGFKHRTTDIDILFYTLVYSEVTAIVEKSILFSMENGTWMLYLYEKMIEKTHKAIANLPVTLNSESAENIFSFIASSKVCPGNLDFPDLISWKIKKTAPEHFLSLKGN